MNVRSAILSLSLLPGLAAQEAWFVDVQLHLAAPLGAGSASLRDDLRAHLGSGIGASLGYELEGPHAFRVSVDFLGTRSSAWPGDPEGRDLNDIWRTLRYGIEHRIAFESFCLFYGGGLQNAWVNRTEGSLGQATLLAAMYALGWSSDSVHYSVHRTELDITSGFATAGLGWLSTGGSATELRWVGASYLRYVAEGLRTIGPAPRERRFGHQAILTLRFRMR